MHPSLAPHLHEDCLDLIEQLHSCHTEHPFAKFLGKCNDVKRALRECLKEEDLKRRRRNLEESKLKQKRLREFCNEQAKTESGKQ